MSRAARPYLMKPSTPLANIALAAAIALSVMAEASAQIAAVAPAPLPRAGEVLRDDASTPQTMPALPQAGGADAGARPDNVPAVSFVLRSVELRGATALTPSQIELLAQPYVGKTMNEADLAAFMAALRKRYEDKGLGLASIGYPTQDLAQGVLKVDVLEPRLARIQLPTTPDAPVSEARVRGLLSLYNIETGGLLDTLSLERVMFALNDSPGVQAKATLAPTGDEGVYNLAIQTTPQRGWDASLVLDNQGAGSTGRVRLTGVGRLNNPLGMGDNLDVQTLISNGGHVRVGRIAYELPVAYTPARLSVAYAKVKYAVRGDFADIDPYGTARVAEANLSYPLIRSRTRTLMARVGAESKNLTDQLGAFELRGDKRILAGTAGLNYESRDTFLGGGFNGASANFHWGHLKFKTEADAEFDAAAGEDYRTAGRFGRVELQYSRLQNVVKNTALYVSASQQLASRNLDSAEKMTLGGSRGVRAYPTAEGASDEASLLNSELRFWLNRNWTVFALYDWAKGRRTRDVAQGNDVGNDVFLHGAGMGLVASYPDWATVKATVAWRGKQPALTDSGNSKVRLFVQAQHTF